MSSLFTVMYKPVITKNDKVDTYLFGDKLVKAKNIPVSYSGISLFSGYALVFPKYLRLPNPNVTNKTLKDIFVEMVELPYVEDQNDPALIWEKGGNCQAFSVYLRTAFAKKGVTCGYLPLSDHVCVWAVVDGALYRIDVVTKEFSLMSVRDRVYLENVMGKIEVD